MPGDKEADTAANTAAVPHIDRTTMKIPPFWPEKPALWFAQLEGQFVLNHITQDTTKYYYVSANLDSRYASEVEDILLNPPATDKYDKIKGELIKRLSASREQQIKRLLEHEEIGDRTPSQFLRRLKTLAGTEIPTDFLRTLWVGRLPNNMQAILATQAATADLDTVANLADKIAEITPKQLASTSASENPLIYQLSEHINSLSLQVQELMRGRSQHRSRSNSQSRSISTARICWYHRRFKDGARKCIQPCNYESQKNAQVSQ